MTSQPLQKVVIANWKMAASFKQAVELAKELRSINSPTQMVIAPSFIHLSTVRDIVKGSNIEIITQDISKNDYGAFTGEIAAEQIKEMHIIGSIVGHSERRKYFNESDLNVYEKISQLTKHDLLPVVCIGEDLETREKNEALAFLARQIEALKLQNFDGKIIVAYEPIWAIGTGKVATIDQILEVAEFIHSKLPYTKILYGGSVSAANAASIAQISNISGALVGGASLKIEEFKAIVSSFGN